MLIRQLGELAVTVISAKASIYGAAHMNGVTAPAEQLKSLRSSDFASPGF